MQKLKVLDLFAGIGGFSLGLERTGGFETVAFCEIESFPQKILQQHWPEVPIYDDVRKLTAETIWRDGIAPNVVTGGFPCQDISVAGNQLGISEKTRSGLWSECLRLTRELRPEYAVFENVTNLLSGPSEKRGGWFSRILCDLASIGYDAEWHVIPASFVGAWHRRSRVWILAYRKKIRSEGRATPPLFQQSNLQKKLERGFEKWPGRPNLPPSRFLRKSNGVPNRMDRTEAIGNAVVPQITELIGYAILEHEKQKMEFSNE
jgi:DNA (cytosine-5)-methyltransferase 1